MSALQPTLMFLHGWAFDGSLWEALRRELADWPHAVIDAGYFGPHARPAVCGPVVAIGHSQGALRLMQHPPAQCLGMVSVNGFTRFCAAPGFPQGQAGRVLDRMLARLQSDPAAVVNDFRARCGAHAAAGPLDARQLQADLRALKTDDARAALASSDLPLLILAGRQDPIVSAAMTQAAFAGRPVTWHDDAAHLLPVSAPAWCAARIREFVLGLAAAAPDTR